MKNLKNSLLVSALSLGIVMGGVGIASAATSTDYSQRIADWIKNDPNPMVMNMNSTVPTSAAPTGATLVDSSSASSSNSTQATPNNTQQPTTQPAVQPSPQQFTSAQVAPQKPAAAQTAPQSVTLRQPVVSGANMSQSDLYNQMVNNCIEWDQQMMQQYANPQNRAAMQQQWQNRVQPSQNVQKSNPNWNSNYGSNGNRMSGNGSGSMGW